MSTFVVDVVVVVVVVVVVAAYYWYLLNSNFLSSILSFIESSSCLISLWLKLTHRRCSRRRGYI